MEQPEIHTKRLLIREIRKTDLHGMFELDSNPNVHLYIERKPVKTLAESENAIKLIRQQYVDHQIGRWAVEEKKTGKFIGWTGFKLNTDTVNGYTNFIDLGYRFIETTWGQGYASESALAVMKYAFKNLPYETIHGIAMTENTVSNKILKKVGLKYVNTFSWDGDICHWYSVQKKDWLTQNSNL